MGMGMDPMMAHPMMGQMGMPMGAHPMMSAMNMPGLGMGMDAAGMMGVHPMMGMQPMGAHPMYGYDPETATAEQKEQHNQMVQLQSTMQSMHAQMMREMQQAGWNLWRQYLQQHQE